MAIQLSLSSLLQKVPLESWKQRIVEIAADLGLDVDNWSEGGFTRTLVAIFARLHTTAGEGIPTIAAGHFLDYASGDWLTLLAKQVYNVDRIEATYASAVQGITLTNTGGGLFVFEAGDIVFANADTQKTYRNTSGGTLPPLGTLKLDLEAEEPGAASNALVGKITQLVTTFLGVTCTNTIALVGLDEQKDPELRALCRASVAARSIGGVKKAYEFYAKTAKREDGTPIGVTRVLIPPADGTGTGPIYLASAAGAIAAPDVARVQKIFDEKVTPYGFNGIAVSATNHPITAPNTIWIPSSRGLGVPAVQKLVADALSSYVNTAPIGGFVIPPAGGMIYWRALLGVIENSIPDALGTALVGVPSSPVMKAELASEVDIPLMTHEVPVWAGAETDTVVILVT